MPADASSGEDSGHLCLLPAPCLACFAADLRTSSFSWRQGVIVLFVPGGAVVANNQGSIFAVAEQPLPKCVFASAWRRVSLAALSALSIPSLKPVQ